ncbi:hypothetical protein GGS23DRAFT_266968 [Durotheca rogersii]|uniref:uncharacterized protein n=1 Tax=Durotheca rogersii TaxID=419775 RepID=UPI002220AD3B|nr:uncharacterized protein GGS23DRAFT_266968 [Durotheca rogersii]KAI5859710.1 hypothetical protein GGS23DRAFT_266968 [Durotheca rogersii]
MMFLFLIFRYPFFFFFLSVSSPTLFISSSVQGRESVGSKTLKSLSASCYTYLYILYFHLHGAGTRG